MGAIDKIDADHSVLCSKNIGVNFSECFPPDVIVAIACGPLKIGFCDLMILEG